MPTVCAGYGGTGRPKRPFFYVLSYDTRGRVTSEYLFLPGNAPVQKFEYTYDLAGKILDESYFNGYDPIQHQWLMENLKETQYDPLQREKQINIDGQRRFTLEYQPRGSLAREKLYVPGQTQPLEELDYTFTLQDWVKRITTPGTTPNAVDLSNAYYSSPSFLPLVSRRFRGSGLSLSPSFWSAKNHPLNILK